MGYARSWPGVARGVLFLSALLLLLGGCVDKHKHQDTLDAAVLADGVASCTGQLLQGEVVNARDLGGQLLPSGAALSCGQLLRGGALGGLTAAGCQTFSGLGIRKVIDLREAAVQSAQPPPACVSKLATHVAAPMPKLLPDTPENYLALLEEQAAVRAVFAALAAPEGMPAYVHCVIGRDRASFVSALILLAAGASRQTVLEEFQLSEAAGVAVKPESLSAVLDALEAQGGIEAYLQSCGVPATELVALRGRLGAS